MGNKIARFINNAYLCTVNPKQGYQKQADITTTNISTMTKSKKTSTKTNAAAPDNTPEQQHNGVSIQRRAQGDNYQLRLSYTIKGKRVQQNVPGAVYPKDARKNSKAYKDAYKLATAAAEQIANNILGNNLAAAMERHAQNPKLSATKRAQLSRAAELCAKSPIANVTLESLKPEQLQNFNDYLLGEGYKANTVRSYMEQTIWALGQECKTDGGGINAEQLRTLKGVKRPKAENDNRAFIEETDMERLLATPVPGMKDAELIAEAFRLSYYTGLRYSDIRALTPDNITAKGIRLRMQKTSGVIFVPISDKAKAVLDKNPGLFGALKQQTVQANKVLAKWAQAAGVKAVNADGGREGVTFHAARHSFATSLINKGVPIEQISRLLGHKSIKTTQIYAKVTDATLQSAVDML